LSLVDPTCAKGASIGPLASPQLHVALAPERIENVAVRRESAGAYRRGRSDIRSETRLAIPNVEPLILVEDEDG
jgi:hypothetical protein